MHDSMFSICMIGVGTVAFGCFVYVMERFDKRIMKEGK